MGGSAEMNNNYDVIVIGAGPGGVTCSALLAKWGLKTLVIDKNSQPGGKMMTVSQDGFRYEIFPILGAPAAGSHFHTAIEKLGLEKEVELILPDPIGELHYRNSSGETRIMLLPGAGRSADPQDVFDFLGITDADMPEVMRIFTDMLSMNPSELEILDDVSVQQFLARYQIPQSLYAFLAVLESEGTLECPEDVACASEFIKLFQEMQQGGGGRYVGGGYGRMFEAEAKVVEDNGGEVLLRTRVEKIDIKNGKVTGVVTDKGTFQAPVVVSNAGIQPTVLKLVGEEYFDKNYVSYVRELVPSWGVTGVRYILNKPLLEYPMYIIISDNAVSTTDSLLRAQAGEMPEEAYVYIGTNSLYPGMAPQGKQLVYTGITCLASPTAEVKPYLDMAEAAMTDIWPDILNHVESKTHYGPAEACRLGRDSVVLGQGGECFGLAQIVGQCGKHKPSPKAPISGLFYVGFDAGGNGLGTNQAVGSGLNVASLVYDYHQEKMQS